MTPSTVALITYFALFGAIVLGVGYMLRTRGIVFLEKVFEQEEHVAGSINTLLNIGFYLLALGLMFVNADEITLVNELNSVRVVVSKLGSSVLIIAVIHFVNMLVFSSMFRRFEARKTEAEWRQYKAMQPIGTER